MKRRLCGTFGIAIVVAVIASATASSAVATTPVTKAQRELVLVSADMSQGDALERGLYDVIEWSGVGLATATLALRYNAVRILKDDAATRGMLVTTLRTAAAKTTIRAVDLIFVTHGATGEVLFSNARVSMASVRDAILTGLTAAQRAKLRMVFSTACFGASHRQAWRDAGFKTVSGSREIYADSAASYQPFLTSWVAGLNFGIGVTAANAAGATSPWDGIASAWYLSRGNPNWQHVNSSRVTLGNTGLTIATMP